MRPKPPLPWRVIKDRASHYRVGIPKIRNLHCKEPQVVRARGAAMRCLQDRYGWSDKQIADYFGADKLTVTRAIARSRVEVKDALARRTNVPLTGQDLVIAIKMNRAKTGLRAIADRLHRRVATIERALRDAGHEPFRHNTTARNTADPALGCAIGAVPPGHPFYELDQQMLRARSMKHRAVGGWRQSSLADAA